MPLGLNEVILFESQVKLGKYPELLFKVGQTVTAGKTTINYLGCILGYQFSVEVMALCQKTEDVGVRD